ncbi:MAG: serpin family protein [Bacteroidales bacterium]|nr:serpin family protein [Bacteroidales bacterium]
MKRLITIFAFMLALASLPNCGNDTPITMDDNPYAPIVLTSEQDAMVYSGNQFALKLLAAVDAKADGSYIISPLGLQYILGMLLDGADGQTAQEICEVLGYGKDAAAVSEFFGRLIRELPEQDKLTEVSSVRSVLTAPTLNLKANYVSSVSETYKALFEQVDFTKTSAVREKVNNWCSKNTNGMIKEMLLKADEAWLNEVCIMFLDALWFKGVWADKFDKSATENGQFTKADGTRESVKFMKKTASFNLNPSPDGQGGYLSLPYGNGAYSMLIALPAGNATAQDIIQTLSSTGQLPHPGHGLKAEVWLPRFEIDYKVEYQDIMREMGMTTAFSPKADFSRMTDEYVLLDRILQKSVVKVDESGTEAAAVTVASMVCGATPGAHPSMYYFHADRPFLFFITENSTGTILFAGKYGGK